MELDSTWMKSRYLNRVQSGAWIEAGKIYFLNFDGFRYELLISLFRRPERKDPPRPVQISTLLRG